MNLWMVWMAKYDCFARADAGNDLIAFFPVFLCAEGSEPQVKWSQPVMQRGFAGSGWVTFALPLGRNPPKSCADLP
jgi:hypothetical protein